jgi:hypothetical protein
MCDGMIDPVFEQDDVREVFQNEGELFKWKKNPYLGFDVCQLVFYYNFYLITISYHPIAPHAQKLGA